jgi:putative transposase
MLSRLQPVPLSNSLPLMSYIPYLWRKLPPRQQAELLAWRQKQGLPWHKPPHRAGLKTRYHLTAACYEHQSYIGYSDERMQQFCVVLLRVLQENSALIHAWCVLPNHYHSLIETSDLCAVIGALGRMHGRLSFEWNGEENLRGRQVWSGATDRYLRNDRHFWATVNYVHHNPVHHGYVQRWQDWPFSSATEYLAGMEREEVVRIWKEYPVKDYGKGWDEA